MAVCGGRGFEFWPAFGGGSNLLLKLSGAVGNAPGWGGGGPSLSVFVVCVGCAGAYLWAILVGAGITGAPGRAAGYELVEDSAVVVVAVFVLGALWVVPVGAAAAVLGPTPSAVVAFMGLWVYTGMPDMVTADSIN